MRRRMLLAALLLAVVLVVGCASSAPPVIIPDGAAWIAPPPPSQEPPGADRETGSAPGPAPIVGDTFTLRQAVETALMSSPGLRASRARWLAARERPRQVTLPDPTIEYTWFPDPIETRFGPQTHRVALMQKVPWPGRLAAEGSARESDAEVARIGLEIDARNLIAEVTIAWHELVWLHNARSVVQAHRDLASRLATIAESLQARESPEGDDSRTVPGRRSVLLVDALKARAQEAQLSFDQVTIAENLRVAEARLNRLIGRDPLATLPAPAPLADVRLNADLRALSELLLLHRQELDRAAARARVAGHRVEAAKLMAVPDFTLGVMWSAIGQPSTGMSPGGTGFENDALGLSVGINLPIFGGRNQALVDEAAWQQLAAVEEGRQLVLDGLAELTAAFTRACRAERLVVLYRDTLVPQATAALQQIEALQTEDESNFGEMLEAQSVKLNFELALARARTERFIAIARLEQLVGQPLADHLAATGGDK
ncbi:MAG: TolC family protein [Planctomycetota bacterium]